MPRPRKNAGWSLAKKTFLKKKKKRTPPPRASSDDDSDDEVFARRLAAARAAREQQQHPDASSSSDDEAWQDARRRAGAAPADASPPARGPCARAPRRGGPTTWAEAEPLDRDWGRDEAAGTAGCSGTTTPRGRRPRPIGLGLRGGGAAAADSTRAYVRDVAATPRSATRAGRRARRALGEEERRRRGAVRENLQQFLRAAARLERFARALERLGGRGVRENASKPSAIVETARRRVARRFGALM